MPTSPDDLLTVLDHETASGQPDDPRDAARALYSINRLLNRVRTDGIGKHAPPVCDAAIRHLAEACHDDATAFDQQPGRISDLAGATTDAVGTLRYQLSNADRSLLSARLAPIARRCASRIMESGPYSQVPELRAVKDRAGELQRAAAAIPPELVRLHGLDAPIPTTLRYARTSAEAAVHEATAALVAELRRRDRDRMTIRELVAVCHVASHVASYLDASRVPAGSELQPSERTQSWKTARDTLALYSDGIPLPPLGAGRSAALLNAMAVEAAVRRATAGGGTPRHEAAAVRPERIARSTRDVRAERREQRQLQLLANACDTELSRIGNTLVVPPGTRRISEHRTAEWLRSQTFRVTPPDLAPAQPILSHLARQAPALSDEMSVTPVPSI